MIRLSKHLADCGVASRRACEELIRAGRVRVNGRVVTEMGVRVDPEADRVECEGRPVEPPKRLITIMLNKPRGVVVTASDPHAKKTVMEFIDHYKERLYPVGRLDRDSEGLLLFTNDGELAHRLTHPSFHLEKEYEVVVTGGPGRAEIDSLRKGIQLDGKRTQRSSIRFIEARNKRRVYRVIIREGRKRQIRRMFEEAGAKVVGLRRIRLGPVKMGHLPMRAVREIKGPELRALRQAAGLPDESESSA
jgi:23S rRNA pseudouridine2605 synthase